MKRRWIWIGAGLVALAFLMRRASGGSATPPLTVENKPNVMVEDDTAEAIKEALDRLQANDYTRLTVTTPKLAFNYRTIPDKSGCRMMSRGGVNTFWYCP